MKDVDHTKLVDTLAVKLKDNCQAPDWAQFVKTGHGKQRPPVRDDWWQVRAAAILLSVKKLGPVGVSKLRTKYGNRKNNGVKPEYFVRGSGNIIRKILQQLETAKFIKQEEAGVHKGRVLAKEGDKIINEAVKEVKKGN